MSKPTPGVERITTNKADGMAREARWPIDALCDWSILCQKVKSLGLDSTQQECLIQRVEHNIESAVKNGSYHNKSQNHENVTDPKIVISDTSKWPIHLKTSSSVSEAYDENYASSKPPAIEFPNKTYISQHNALDLDTYYHGKLTQSLTKIKQQLILPIELDHRTEVGNDTRWSALVAQKRSIERENHLNTEREQQGNTANLISINRLSKFLHTHAHETRTAPDLFIDRAPEIARQYAFLAKLNLLHLVSQQIEPAINIVEQHLPKIDLWNLTQKTISTLDTVADKLVSTPPYVVAKSAEKLEIGAGRNAILYQSQPLRSLESIKSEANTLQHAIEPTAITPLFMASMTLTPLVGTQLNLGAAKLAFRLKSSEQANASITKLTTPDNAPSFWKDGVSFRMKFGSTVSAVNNQATLGLTELFAMKNGGGGYHISDPWFYPKAALASAANATTIATHTEVAIGELNALFGANSLLGNSMWRGFRCVQSANSTTALLAATGATPDPSLALSSCMGSAIGYFVPKSGTVITSFQDGWRVGAPYIAASASFGLSGKLLNYKHLSDDVEDTQRTSTPHDLITSTYEPGIER